MRLLRRCVASAFLAVPLAFSACGGEPGPLPDAVLTGFASPRAVVHDARADVYLILDAGPDGGSVARAEPGGRVDREWIRHGKDGVELRAPRGLAIAGDLLHVADETAVRSFDRASGESRGSIPIPGSARLEDLSVAPDGELWLVDSGTGEPGSAAVFAVAVDGTVRTVLQGGALLAPSGIEASATGALIVDRQNGVFAQVDRGGRCNVLIRAPEPGLEGLVRVGEGRWLTASAAGKCLYTFDVKGAIGAIEWPELAAPDAPAVDAVRQRLLVPLPERGEVLARKP